MPVSAIEAARAARLEEIFDCFDALDDAWLRFHNRIVHASTPADIAAARRQVDDDLRDVMASCSAGTTRAVQGASPLRHDASAVN